MLYKEINILLINTPLTAERIAAAAAMVLMKQDTDSGLPVLKQTRLAEALEVSMAVIRKVWQLLSDKYRIICARRGIGSSLVKELKNGQRAANEEMIRQALGLNSEAILDSPWLLSLGIKLDAKINSALKRYQKRPNAELSIKLLPQLLELLARFFSGLMSYNFGSDEICYCRNYLEMLTKACEVWCPSRSRIVLLTPVSKKVKSALRNANRSLTFLSKYIVADLLEDLKNCCLSTGVGLVYFGQMMPYPLTGEIDECFWESLKELQQLYGFIILIDNPFPGLLKIPDLLIGQKASTNQSVVIISKPSSHLLLSEINIIAGPSDGIRKFSRKFHQNEPLASPSITYGLLYLLAEGNLQRRERKAYGQLEVLMAEVKVFLSGKGIFMDTYIQNQMAWYIYLELETGTHRRNLYNRLKELNIYVCNPRDYPAIPGFKGGVMISVAFYPDQIQLRTNIERLIKAIIFLTK